MAQRQSTTRGFKRTATLLEGRIRRASESRGFAQSRLLTHWEEIAGAETAAMSRPVEVSYGRKGFGATLTLLTTGANAPILEMQKDAIRRKVNACYGYNAIARIRITQTASSGFTDGEVSFAHGRAKRRAEAAADPAVCKAATELADPVGDAGLRQALELLARNVLSKHKT